METQKTLGVCLPCQPNSCVCPPVTRRIHSCLLFYIQHRHKRGCLGAPTHASSIRASAHCCAHTPTYTHPLFLSLTHTHCCFSLFQPSFPCFFPNSANQGKVGCAASHCIRRLSSSSCFPHTSSWKTQFRSKSYSKLLSVLAAAAATAARSNSGNTASHARTHYIMCLVQLGAGRGGKKTEEPMLRT